MRRLIGITKGQVTNCINASTEKHRPISVVEALKFSFMYSGKKGPRQVVTVALQATHVIRKARRALAGGGAGIIGDEITDSALLSKGESLSSRRAAAR